MSAIALMALMRYQLAPGDHTMSRCANDHCCTSHARGGRECLACLRLLLIEECGSVDAVDSFIASHKATVALQSRIAHLSGEPNESEKGGEP